MKRFTNFFLISFTLFFYSKLVFSSNIISLQDAYKMALEKNESISIQESKINQLNEKINQAKGAIWPKLNFNAGITKQDVASNSTTRSEQTYMKLNASQSLFHGLKEFYSLNISRLDHKAQKEQAEQIKINLYLQVAQLYYYILSTKADLKNLNEQIELTNLRIKELKERTRVGRSRKADLLTAESQKALISSQIDSTNWQLTIYKENFSYLTGIKNINDFEFADLSTSPLRSSSTLTSSSRSLSSNSPTSSISLLSIDEYLKSIEERADIKSLRTQTESYDESISNAKANYYPSLDLSGNYYFNRSPTTINSTVKTSKWDVSLTLTMPLFDGMITSSQVSEAASKLNEKKLQLIQSRRLAEQEIKIAYDKIKSGISQLSAIHDAIIAADKAYKEQLKDYSNGMASNLDVLQSQNSLLDTKKNYDRTKYQISLWISELQAATGKIKF